MLFSAFLLPEGQLPLPLCLPLFFRDSLAHRFPLLPLELEGLLGFCPRPGGSDGLPGLPPRPLGADGPVRGRSARHRRAELQLPAPEEINGSIFPSSAQMQLESLSSLLYFFECAQAFTKS